LSKQWIDSGWIKRMSATGQIGAVVGAVVLAGTMTVALAAPPPVPEKSAAPESHAAPAKDAATAKPGAPATTKVDRGRYLTETLGCGDCHTPQRIGPNGLEPDRSRLFSGHPESLVMPPAPKLPAGPWLWVGSMTNTAFAGPWGVSYAINLTPDEVSGLGPWTEEMFVASLKSGLHWGEGREIMPPMPWKDYSRLTDDDLSAIWAYLHTLPAIRNTVPSSESGPPPAAAK
jgi:mono/diheme cytochrome c family protein